MNVGDHFPWKGVGTDHAFVVHREKKKRWIKAYTGRECPFKEPKSAFVCVLTCLFIKQEGTCFQGFTKKCSYFSYSRVSRLFTEKREYINVNSKIYIVQVYTSKRTRNKNTISEFERGCVLLIASCKQVLIITCTSLMGHICTGHCNLRNKRRNEIFPLLAVQKCVH